MIKPYKEYIFRQVQGVWRDVAGDSGTLADILNKLEIIIDDNTEFARIKMYDYNCSIWYRANFGKVTITIWKIDTEKKCLHPFLRG